MISKLSSKLAILSAYLLILACISCGTAAIDKWGGKIYVYVGNDLAFERKQDNEIIPYNSPKAGGMFCMTREDFMSFLETYVVTPKLQSPKN